jgi:hypothetical protein
LLGQGNGLLGRLDTLGEDGPIRHGSIMPERQGRGKVAGARARRILP